jgi:hypothetical protein
LTAENNNNNNIGLRRSYATDSTSDNTHTSILQRMDSMAELKNTIKAFSNHNNNNNNNNNNNSKRPSSIRSSFDNTNNKSGANTPSNSNNSYTTATNHNNNANSTTGGGQNNASNHNNNKAQHFIAIWEDNLSLSPVCIQVESPIRALAVGRSGGSVDRMDLLLLGYSDGRVVITALVRPYPVIEVVVPVFYTTLTPSPINNNNVLSSVNNANNNNNNRGLRSANNTNNRSMMNRKTSKLELLDNNNSADCS